MNVQTIEEAMRLLLIKHFNYPIAFNTIIGHHKNYPYFIQEAEQFFAVKFDGLWTPNEMLELIRGQQ